MRTALLRAAAVITIAATPAVAQRTAPPLPQHGQTIATSTLDKSWLPSRLAVDPDDMLHRPHIRTSPAIDKSRGSLLKLGPGDSVGYTYYDLQTNAAMPDRIINWPNASKPLESINSTMVWTASTDPPPKFNGYAATTRGTYGAFHSGEAWSPMRGGWTRLEEERTGFVEIDHLADGRVILANHTNDLVSVLLELDAGSSEFVPVAIPGSERGLWASLAVSDNDDIHVIWSYTTDDVNEDQVFYSRSTDQGNSFSFAVPLSGPNSVVGQALRTGFGANTYAISARGNNVAVWYLTSSIELMQLRSPDRGETWPAETAVFLYSPTNIRRYHTTESVDEQIWPDPTFGADTAIGFRTDTVAGPGSSLDMMLDDDGYTHGIVSIYPTYVRRYYPPDGDTTATTYRNGIIYQATYNYTDVAMLYLRERDNSFFSSTIAQPGRLDNTADPAAYPDYYIRRPYHGGFSMYPQLGMDASGNVYATFSSGVEGDVQQERRRYDSALKSWLNHHVFVTWMRADDPQRRWLPAVDLTPRGLDAKFAALADLVDDELHIAYQIDPNVGEFITDTLAPVARDRNNVEVLFLPQSSLGNPAPVRAEAASNGAVVSISPNPTRGAANVTVLCDAGAMSMRLVDPLGRTVTSIFDGDHLGGSLRRTFETDDLPSGIYFLVTRSSGGLSTIPLEVVR